jgi:hypothetical protein
MWCARNSLVGGGREGGCAFLCLFAHCEASDRLYNRPWQRVGAALGVCRVSWLSRIPPTRCRTCRGRGRGGGGAGGQGARTHPQVVCSIVLEEVKHKNASAYQRLRALCASPTKRFFVFANENHRDTYVKAAPGESPNDRNDRAIRVATTWYAARLGDRMKVVLLTNDGDNRRKAAADGLDARSVLAYARSLKVRLRGR